MSIKVGIIDYGSGNFSSVWNAVQKLDCPMVHVQKFKQTTDCTHLILPGVGAFSSAIKRLQELELFHPIKESIDEAKKPFLGICVGMQTLAEEGSEFTPTRGFGKVKGRVDHFLSVEPKLNLRLPHIGWNDVLFEKNSTLFQGIDPEESNFYFDHSYQFISEDKDAFFSHCEYGRKFIAAFEKENTFGVQFHPEKSQHAGLRMIANFLSWRP